MKLCKFHLRYHPPGILLEYVQSGVKKIKTLDLLSLSANSDTQLIAYEICQKEDLITPNVVIQLKDCLNKLRKKLQDEYPPGRRFYIYKTLQSHLLPLTNVSFCKSGKRCLTGSYDRTCKVWNIETGVEEHTLTGHKNVVYSVGYNFPVCNKIVTGSFDKTAKIWDSATGECLLTLSGHNAEVVATSFSPNGDLVGTASMDHVARVFHATTGQEILSLTGHDAEVIALNFNNVSGQELITGSFDGTIAIWDVRIKDRITTLRGHDGGISNCVYNWDCSVIGSGSLDKTARVWDTRNYKCLTELDKHTDEVLDVAFDWCGQRLATVSADCSSIIHNIKMKCDDIVLTGHSEEISKVCFSPGGAFVLTASADHCARIWDSYTGKCVQVLAGHRGEVFSCAFNYLGDAIVTASKDNTCRVWR